MGIDWDNDYKDAIKEFKDYVSKTNSKPSEEIHEGFLIDYTELVKLEKNSKTIQL